MLPMARIRHDDAKSWALLCEERHSVTWRLRRPFIPSERKINDAVCLLRCSIFGDGSRQTSPITILVSQTDEPPA